MKESRFVLTILLMLCIVMGLSLTGCSHDHDASPADSTNERLLTYEEQMAKIQRLQEEILDDLPMSRIQEIHDIIRYADSVYLDATSIAYGDLDEWYRTRLRIVTSELSTSATEDTITYFYERVFDADNFTGIFTYDKAVRRIEMEYCAESYVDDTLSINIEETDPLHYNAEITKLLNGKTVTVCRSSFMF